MNPSSRYNKFHEARRQGPMERSLKWSTQCSHRSLAFDIFKAQLTQLIDWNPLEFSSETTDLFWFLLATVSILFVFHFLSTLHLHGMSFLIRGSCMLHHIFPSRRNKVPNPASRHHFLRPSLRQKQVWFGLEFWPITISNGFQWTAGSDSLRENISSGHGIFATPHSRVKHAGRKCAGTA